MALLSNTHTMWVAEPGPAIELHLASLASHGDELATYAEILRLTRRRLRDDADRRSRWRN